MDLAGRRRGLGRALDERLRTRGRAADEDALGRGLGGPVLGVEDGEEAGVVEPGAEHAGDPRGIGRGHEARRQHDEIWAQDPLHPGGDVLDLEDGPVVGVELDPGRRAPQELDAGERAPPWYQFSPSAPRVRSSR